MSIAALIAKHSTPDCDCLIWQRTCSNGHPAWRINGKSVLVRRALWAELHGAIPAGKIVRATCANTRCLNAAHMALTTHKQLALDLGPSVMGGLVRSANVARAKRLQACARLNQTLVDEIRSTSETGTSLARRLGVSQILISRVRRHQTWKDYSGPFVGLGART